MTEVMKELVKNVPGVLTDRSVKSLWTLLKRELEEGGGKGKCLCSVLSWVFLYGSFTVHWCLTQTQIMLARDSTGRKKFLVWESEENEFETLFQVLLKWPWNWLHKGTIHLILTKSYFCFNRRTQQLEIAYLSISNFSWCRTQIILPWAYFSISFIIGCLEPSSIKRFSVSFEIAGFNTKTKKLNREVEGSIFQFLTVPWWLQAIPYSSDC